GESRGLRQIGNHNGRFACVSARKAVARRAFALLSPAFVAVAIAACGGSSSDQATSLLKQTFSGTHAINSGNVNVALILNPSGSGTLGKLGINPLHGLVNPTIAGNDTVGGASTTHIRAGVNVPALLRDLNTFLGKASSVGVSGAARLPSSISPATRTRIANEV